MTIIAPLSVEVSFMFMVARNKTKRKLCSHELGCDYSENGNPILKCRQTDIVADQRWARNRQRVYVSRFDRVLGMEQKLFSPRRIMEELRLLIDPVNLGRYMCQWWTSFWQEVHWDGNRAGSGRGDGSAKYVLCMKFDKLVVEMGKFANC